jgi:hypothetical protein
LGKRTSQNEEERKKPDFQAISAPVHSSQYSNVGATGFELPSNPTQKTAIHENSAAKSGALTVESDPDLAYMIARWPTLRARVRADILALVKAEGTTE